MSLKDVKLFMIDYRRMLEDVKNKLRKNNTRRNWEYDLIFPYFFQEYIHLDPARTDSNHGNQPQGQAQIGGPSGDNGLIYIQPTGYPEVNISNDPQLGEHSEGNASHQEDEEVLEDPFLGYIENAGTPVYSNSLTREECNHEHCIYGHLPAQCTDPIHTDPGFNCSPLPSQLSKNNILEHNTSKRKRSPSNTGGNNRRYTTDSPTRNCTTPAYYTSNYHNMTPARTVGARSLTGSPRNYQVPRTPTHSVPGSSNMAPPPISYEPLPDEVAVRDHLRPGKVYWKFNPLLHERVGSNQMKIKMMDPTNTFPTTYTSNIIYRPGNNNLFETTLEVPSHLAASYIRGEGARAAFIAGFQLAPSTADLGPRNSSKKFLDSHITVQSGLFLVQEHIQQLDIEIVETASGCKEEDIVKLFSTEGYQATNFVNFTGGWSLTVDFAKFAKDSVLSIKNFQNALMTCPFEIVANTTLLARERETRLLMIHSFSILHYQELFTGKVEAVPVEYRVQAEFSPDLSRGLCKMQLVQIKYYIARWMVAKMRLRKDILKDSSRAEVRWMYKQTMGCRHLPQRFHHEAQKPQ